MLDLLFGSAVTLDPGRTAEAYRSLKAPDPQCCSACATFLRAVERKALPESFFAFLVAAGVDPRKPQEVWGAPDGGFLSAWWLFSGFLAGDDPPGSGALEVTPGFTCYIMRQLSMGAPFAFAGAPFLQLEMAWRDDQLKDLEREAWPRSTSSGA